MSSFGNCGERKQKFSPSNPHFFKIILEETLQSNKLQIPNKFVRLYGDTLSDPISLEIPFSLRWEVGLTKSYGKVWIDKGWTDFSKYYSVGRGDLLVFRYEGNSKFHVLIFDKTTTEIDYPFNPNCSENHDEADRKPHGHEFFVEEETEDDHDSVEILESFSHSPKSRAKSPLTCPRPHKRMRTNPVDRTQSNQPTPRRNEGGGGKSLPPRGKKCGDERRKQLNAKEKAQALKKASGFKSKYPFFVVAMQPSYVGAKYYLSLPSFFVKKYLKSKDADVILKAQDGKTWAVKCNFGVNKKTPKANFQYGWKAFVMDNDLKIGDVCVFVLTKSIDLLFEVSIFPENGNSRMLPVHKAATSEVGRRGSLSSKVKAVNTMDKKTEMAASGECLKSSTVSKKERALERASDFRSENPFFTVALTASYTTKKCRLYIPQKFAKTYINKIEGNSILKNSDGKSWSVLYKVRDRLNGPPAAEFCNGWTAFVLDNSLEEGDICTFELTNRNEIAFEVSIVKNKDRLAHGKLTKLISEEHGSGKVIQRPSSSGLICSGSKAASQFFSPNPFFQVTLRPFHLKQRLVNLPTAFSESYFAGKAKTVILQVGTRSWPVTLVSDRSDYKFSGGWSAFAKENALRLGDVCVFELINRSQVVLKVSIFGQNS